MLTKTNGGEGQPTALAGCGYFTLESVETLLKRTQAETLLVVEATYHGSQCEAIKTLVKRVFNKSLDSARESASPPKTIKVS